MGTDADKPDNASYVWESGPSDPPQLCDGPGVILSVAIDAPPSAAWAFVSDIEFGTKFSEEFVAARWADGHTGASLGAEFIGSNVHDSIGEWDISCFIDRFVPEREFGWATSDIENPGARWRFVLEPTETGCTLAYHLYLGPGPSGLTTAIERMPDLEPRIIGGRLKQHATNMQTVIEGIKQAAEATAA